MFGILFVYSVIRFLNAEGKYYIILVSLLDLFQSKYLVNARLAHVLANGNFLFALKCEVRFCTLLSRVRLSSLDIIP